MIKGRAREEQVLDEPPEAVFGSLRPWHEGRKDRFVRVTAAKVSGRCFTVEPTTVTGDGAEFAERAPSQ